MLGTMLDSFTLPHLTCPTISEIGIITPTSIIKNKAQSIVLFQRLYYSSLLTAIVRSCCLLILKCVRFLQKPASWGSFFGSGNNQSFFFFFFNFEELQHRHSGQHKTKWDPGFATENSQQMEKPQLRVYESLLGIKAKLLNVGWMPC